MHRAEICRLCAIISLLIVCEGLSSDNCVLPMLEHSLSVGRVAVLKTGPLPPQDHKSGTVFRPISGGC